MTRRSPLNALCVNKNVNAMMFWISKLLVCMKRKNLLIALCPYKCGRKDSEYRHIATELHMKRKSPLNALFVHTNVLTRRIWINIAVVHEKKRPFLCSLCTYKSGQKKDLTKHIAAAHKKKKSFGFFLVYQFSENHD